MINRFVRPIVVKDQCTLHVLYIIIGSSEDGTRY